MYIPYKMLSTLFLFGNAHNKMLKKRKEKKKIKEELKQF